MFGKRNASTDAPQRPPLRRRRSPPARRRAAGARRAADRAPSRRRSAARRSRVAPTPKQQAARVAADNRSEDYYQIKTTIFRALIDTIDLAQLAQLDPDSAREEIRDIVNEIISIKAVVMSIAEQEHLLQDICNDVLGYGPLEPLLARDDIADIMVNGANRVFIEVGGKVQLTNDPLPRQRAADEHLPAHRQPGRPPRRRKLADLRRAPARRLPRQRDRAAAVARRADAHHS